MQIYLDLVMLLNFLVDFLLLLGTNRLCGYPMGVKKAALAAAFGSVYAGACMLPGFSFLGNFLWRIVSLLLMSGFAFGFTKNALRRGMVFSILSMAMGGIVLLMNSRGFWSVAASAAFLGLLCTIGFRNKLGVQTFVPVELTYGEKKICLTALQDTGNTLKDPVTGRDVLVVGADVAHKLIGLTRSQLRSPVEFLNAIPGLRLIPYRTVGQESGFLLALKLNSVKIGNQQGSALVAFAPEGLHPEGAYQALTGGSV